ncbi:MAG: DUF2268 domain-containing putative Zn-dependent protease [Candidatus Saccharimonadales bacterium]
MLTTINNLEDLDAQQSLLVQLQQYYDEVRILLPKLPKDLEIYFDNFCVMEDFGTGGFAYDEKIMTVGFDTNFSDKDRQLKALRATVFHESYHLAQGYHSKMGNILPIEEAVYEGAATVFERDYADGEAPYGEYANQPVEKWITEIEQLDGSYDRNKWKFWDDAEKVGWKLYKVGTFLADKAVIVSGKSIVELNNLPAKDIIQIAKTESAI